MSARTWRTFLPGAGTMLVFCALLLQPETASAAVIRGMQLFVTKLIPVLFPYMVLSRFFVTYQLLAPLGSLTGLGKENGTVFFLGQLCGYPMGAKMTREMVQQGRLDPGAAAMLCAFSSGASPAFLLHSVGGDLWHSTGYGVFLLVAQLTIGWLGTRLWQRRDHTGLSIQPPPQATPPFARIFCDAVVDSTQQTLFIGGYIVSFTLLVAIAAPLLPEKLSPLFAAILEFSTGTRLAAGMGGLAGLFCTGFAVGFGGLSVLAQTACLLEDTGVSLRPYVLWKLSCGVLMGLASLVWGSRHPALLSVRYATGGGMQQSGGVWLVCFWSLLGILWYVVRRGDRRAQ